MSKGIIILIYTTQAISAYHDNFAYAYIGISKNCYRRTSQDNIVSSDNVSAYQHGCASKAGIYRAVIGAIATGYAGNTDGFSYDVASKSGRLTDSIISTVRSARGQAGNGNGDVISNANAFVKGHYCRTVVNIYGIP
ncbi:hypothetical protein COU00_00590 [Candidatus Falkowbacteria bacterium CG10_big_fil_rev_8_21_14_0_10_43_11]|uniref:Uncharacterized protein n=1 Tax=Candidatus Falkowbacteria bacterium CG10_big_fil_rev_8_21_14_0_10_43_11 TaxID=1974568 RepID=A0A2M6WMZ1_9BACT|nr:MAG: hypothetical protein COU00_00590 [Candidatus Falkowbacteria bacterium CG10_big_fil_rev_8_21_14_0_10_43_11]